MFGGFGYSAFGNGALNDLWKFDISIKQWVWVSGDSLRNSIGNYGIKGVQSVTNKPKPRVNSVGWADASGNLWFFGGDATFYTGGSNGMNDLWKYNIASNQWTWMSGDSTLNAPGNYGVKGITSSANKPGARVSSSAWYDVSGNLFLFGGLGNASNDLWKYNLASNQWTWIKGDSSKNPLSNFGIKGIASPLNTPGGKYSCTSWTDMAGNFWLFSGISTDGILSDLWKYNAATNEWTWVKGNNNNPGSDTAIYGFQGVPSPTNNPGPRLKACAWTDATGKLWMFGGQGVSIMQYYNNLWNYDITTNQWTWVSGDSISRFLINGIYDKKGTASSINKPGSRYISSGWTDTNNDLWMFGGWGANVYTGNLPMNDFWKYNIASKQWTWEKGDSVFAIGATFGTKGISSPKNRPSPSTSGLSWTDKVGNFWLYQNSLWKFDKTTKEWTWVHGDTSKPNGNYGIKGVSSINNFPPDRSNSKSWNDKFENFWLFGGFTSGISNDLWKYNSVTNQWTWVNGDSTTGKPTVYGVKGISSTNNNPGARNFNVSWVDTLGVFWLFGGVKYNSNNSSVQNYLNDLWKYNSITNEWTWVSGDSTLNNASIYGSKGIASPNNKPSSRNESVAWFDNTGNLWLFGGFGYKGSDLGYLSDLWKYNIASNQWTWVNGDSIINKLANYGVKNISSVSNIPGARRGSVAYTNVSGNLCLFGGFAFNPTLNSTFRLNDLWSYDIATNEWTWKNGDSAINQMGQYDVKGVTSAFGKPGARFSAVGSRDNEGNLWLYSGSGFSSMGIGVNTGLNDLWKYNAETVQPVTLLSFTGKQKDKDAQLTWVVENEISFKRYQVERSSNGRNFETIGSLQAASINGSKHSYSFTDYSVFNTQKVVYYRLKMVDKDGSFRYSNIVKLAANTNPQFTIFPNPATTSFQVVYSKNMVGKVSIDILDINGKIVDSKTVETNGSFINFSTKKLIAGTYTVRVIKGNEVFTNPLVIVK